MAKRALPGAVLALLLFCPWTLKAQAAQATEKPLTNGDVASTGLPESTIVLAIQLAGQRGSTSFDTSPAGLIELKNSGATEKVLNAVLKAQAHKPAPPESPVPGLPAKPGVYYQGPSDWLSLPSCLLWPAFTTSLRAATTFWTEGNVMVLPGQQAQIQISERKPALYARGHVEQRWQLLRVLQRGDRRELRLAPSDTFSAEIRFRPSDVREIALAPLGHEVFTITPRVELEPGEYLLCTEVPAARRLLQCYEFGIAAASPSQTPGGT